MDSDLIRDKASMAIFYRQFIKPVLIAREIHSTKLWRCGALINDQKRSPIVYHRTNTGNASAETNK